MAAPTREAMEELRELLAGAYGLVPSQLKLLEGYEDRTYQVLAGEARYILKSQRASDMLRERVALENQLTQSLKSAETFDFPRPVQVSR